MHAQSPPGDQETPKLAPPLRIAAVRTFVDVGAVPTYVLIAGITTAPAGLTARALESSYDSDDTLSSWS